MVFGEKIITIKVKYIEAQLQSRVALLLCSSANSVPYVENEKINAVKVNE